MNPQISRREFLYTASATIGAAALLELQPTKKVEAAKPPSQPEWAFPGEHLGVSVFADITTEISLTPKGKNRVDSVQSGTLIPEGDQKQRYFPNEYEDFVHTTRIQELTEGSKGILVVKSEDETGPHFLIRREIEKVEVAPVYGGQITEVLAVNPYQLAVLEKVSPNTVWSYDPKEWLFVRRLIRQKPGIWKNITSAYGEPFVTSFGTRPDWGNSQQVSLGLENGILTVSHTQRTGSDTNVNVSIMTGPDLKHVRSGPDQILSSIHPIDHKNIVTFDSNSLTGGYNLAVIDVEGKRSFKPVLKWGSIGIEGASAWSSRVNVYDKNRQNALAAFTYDDHQGKRSYALFHLNWETPFVTAFNHRVTGHALGYLEPGEQITGFDGIDFFGKGAIQVEIITNKERTFDASKILLKPWDYTKTPLSNPKDTNRS